MKDEYWWFEGESVAELARRLGATENARLEVRIDRDKHMTLRVVAHGAAVQGGEDINVSHVCPPFC